MLKIDDTAINAITPADFDHFISAYLDVTTGSAEPLIGHGSNPATSNLVVPEALLQKQGALMFAYLTGKGPEIDPPEEREKFRRLLFDAAWKTQRSNGDTALHWAIHRGDKESVAALIQAAKDKPELLFHANNLGETALHEAIRKGNKESAAVLIQAVKDKPELLFHANKCCDTILHEAIRRGDKESAAVLIQAGKDKPELLFHANTGGDTALHEAIYRQDKESAAALIQIGKNNLKLLFHANNNGNTALHVVVNKGDKERAVELGVLASQELINSLKKTQSSQGVLDAITTARKNIGSEKRQAVLDALFPNRTPTQPSMSVGP